MRGSELRRTIDRMVTESIRRILPEIMNEVLLRTIAESGILDERPVPVRRQQPPPPHRRKRPPSSLADILDESAGSEFYRQEEDARPSAPPQLAKRLQDLPPELRVLAEDTVSRVSEGAPEPMDLGEAESLGFDFERMREALGIVEQQAPKPLLKDSAAEERRLARLRESLNVQALPPRVD